MQLSKRVPSRTKTLTARWCRKDFCENTEVFQNIRSGARNKMDKCHWCEYPFADGEMMALACFEKGGNKTLCADCADELLASDCTAKGD